MDLSTCRTENTVEQISDTHLGEANQFCALAMLRIALGKECHIGIHSRLRVDRRTSRFDAISAPAEIHYAAGHIVFVWPARLSDAVQECLIVRRRRDIVPREGARKVVHQQEIGFVPLGEQKPQAGAVGSAEFSPQDEATKSDL